MRSVYKFKLNYTKTTHSSIFGHTCPSTPWTCTGTGCILLACTGPVPVQVLYQYRLDLYRYRLASSVLYRYSPVPIPVHPREFAQICYFCPLLVPKLFIQLPHSLTPQKSSWNSSKNNSITHELVIWNLIPQNPR